MMDPFEEIRQQAKQRYFLLFFCLPTFLLVHAIFYYYNLHDTTLYLFTGMRISVGGVFLNAALYGVFLSSLVFIVRQGTLTDQIKKLTEQLKDEKNFHANTKKRLDKLTAASHKVLVPYHLDQLVNKDLTEFVPANTVPGSLRVSS